MIDVLIADDQELVRTGLRMILAAEPDLRVVGEAEDGAVAVAEARRLAPDVVLMDVKMPNLDGIAATRHIAEQCPDTRVLVLTTFDRSLAPLSRLHLGYSSDTVKRSCCPADPSGRSTL